MLAKVRSAVGAYSAMNNNNHDSSQNDAQIGLVIDVTESDIFGSLLPGEKKKLYIVNLISFSCKIIVFSKNVISD